MTDKADYSQRQWEPTNHMRFERRPRRSITPNDFGVPGSVIILQQKWRHRVSRAIEWRDVPIAERTNKNDG